VLEDPPGGAPRERHARHEHPELRKTPGCFAARAVARIRKARPEWDRVVRSPVAQGRLQSGRDRRAARADGRGDGGDRGQPAGGPGHPGRLRSRTATATVPGSQIG